MSTTTGRPKRCRNSVATLLTKTTASGSSPFTWNTGASIILATSVGYGEDREFIGEVVKPIWLLMTKCTEPPVRWPLRPREPEALGDHALPGKRRIAMDQQRHHHRAVGLLGVEHEMAVDRRALVLLGARLAQHHRIDDLQMRGVGGQRRCTWLPSNSRSDEAPRWYFTSPEPSTSSE